MARPAFIAVKNIVTLFLLAPALACGGGDLVLPGPLGAPASIQIVKGDNQSGAPGTMLPDSIVVKVTDSTGSPLPGQQVRFLPDPARAEVTPQTATTDSAGMAGARWVLDATPGPQHVIALVLGDSAADALQVRFTASATAPGSVPALRMRTQPSASARAGEVFGRQPVVQLLDAHGDELNTPDVPVIAAIASGGGSVGGTTTRLTDANGRAEFDDLRIEGATGSHVLIFAAAGYTSVVSDPVEVIPAETENQPPVAADDEYQTFEGGERTLEVGTSDGVLQNDSDPEGELLVASKESDPANGRVTLDRDGSFRYTPDFSFYGDDTFMYRASDPSGRFSTATVIVHVAPLNDRPRFRLAVDQVVVPREQSPRTVPNFVTGITPGAPNETDQVLIFEVVENSNPGLFAVGPEVTRDSQTSTTGTLTFTPAGPTGSATVTIVMRDNGGTENGGTDTSHSETFTITVE
jgi:hypothetical protein